MRKAPDVREVVVYQLLSLDGVAESPDRFFDWDEALEANLAAVIGRQDAVVLGRRSYEEWAPYWPSSDVEPFATFINTVSKHVATSTPLEPAWAGATAVDGDLVAHVEQLKEEPGADIGVHPDIAGFQDLAHAFDLKSSALAARATLEAALERRETRGAHNRSDYPELDESLQVNLVWSPTAGVTRETIPPIPAEIAALMRDVSVAGKLVE